MSEVLASPKWIVSGEKGLRGNILVTGSIGSGKSAGTILPWFEQFLTNFEPKPSILCLDAKQTFATDALEICKKTNRMDDVVHLVFGGDVRINPIYRDNFLKQGGFSDVAYMLRAATVNFVGRESGDAKFWGEKGSDLTVSTLIYISATSKEGYFTLIDFYNALSDSGQRDFALELRAALKSQDFDEEEAHNIRTAIDYFEKEYNELDPKMKSSITATATVFVSKLREYQASRVFCPKKEDITVKSFDEVVDTGKILVFDIESAGLSMAMATLVKLSYQKSILSRFKRGFDSSRLGILIVDEAQDLVSSGGGQLLGDDTYLAKARQFGSVSIFATQSFKSLENALGEKNASDVIRQSFRTIIACHTTDESTSEFITRIFGKEEVEKISESVSEGSSSNVRNPFSESKFLAPKPYLNVSQSTSLEKVDKVTATDMATLNLFEAYGIIFDGVRTKLTKVCLKPHFLEDKRKAHKSILEGMMACLLFVLFSWQNAFASPTVCSVVNSPMFESCFAYSTTSCTCGYPPRPTCVRHSYYVPVSFIEVWAKNNKSYFSDLPFAGMQLSRATKPIPLYGGIGEEEGYSYRARVIGVPQTYLSYMGMPCGGTQIDKLCFDAMSEDLGRHWETGEGDLYQPKYLAWSVSPKACVMKGSAMGVVGGVTAAPSSGAPMCSVDMSWMPKFPPSTRTVCDGWGIHFPRTGTTQAISTVNASLVVAARMRSLGVEVFQSVPRSIDEKWQMIKPSTSACFREGESLSFVELLKQTNERGRGLLGGQDGFLYVVWKKVSCCKNEGTLFNAQAGRAAMKASCVGRK